VIHLLVIVGLGGCGKVTAVMGSDGGTGSGGANGTGGAAVTTGDGGPGGGSGGSTGPGTGGTPGAGGAGTTGAGGTGTTGAGGAAGAGGMGGVGASTGTGGFPSPYLFYDAFETNADIALFAGGPSKSPHVLSAGGAIASSSYHLNISGPDGYYAGMNYSFMPAIRPSMVRFWIRIPGTGHDGYFVLSSSITTPEGSFAYLALSYNLYQTQPASLANMSSGANWLTTSYGGTLFAADTWYHIEVDFDWSAKTAITKVNDVALEPVNAFTGGGISRLDLFSIGGGADFDEIEMLP
jgi:hypothetical protein